MPREPPVTSTAPLRVSLCVDEIARASSSGESVILGHLPTPAPGLEDPSEVVRPVGWIELDEPGAAGPRPHAGSCGERVPIQPEAVETAPAADGAIDHRLVLEHEVGAELVL